MNGEILQFGRHKGERWTRVPVSYLKWMLNTFPEGDVRAERAEAELARRGTTTPDMEISGHAIDTASLRLRDLWEPHRQAGQGFHSWLIGEAKKALEQNNIDKNGRHALGEIRFVFVMDGKWPVLKTVLRKYPNRPKPSNPAGPKRIRESARLQDKARVVYRRTKSHKNKNGAA